MKLATVLFTTMALGSCYAQTYSGPAGGSVSSYSFRVLAQASAPYSGTLTAVATSFAKVWQVAGNISEPCPWNLPYQDIFDNTWSDTNSRYVIVYSGTFGAKWWYDGTSGTQTWTKTSSPGAGSQFTRNRESEVYDDKPIWTSI